MMSSPRPPTAGKAGIIIELRTAETEPTHRSDEAYWQDLEDFLGLVSTLGIFEGTGASAFVQFGRIELRNVDLARLRRKLAGPVDANDDRDERIARLEHEGAMLLSGLDRAVEELRRRDRRSRRAEDPLVDELEELLA